MITIAPLTDQHWPAVWAIMKPIVRAGETYPYATDMSEKEAHRMWVEVTHRAYVALDESGGALGSYYIKPNQPTLGAHVANCGYMVGENARGRGVGTQLCEHSQSEAVRLGYRAMQYNLVVKTNEAGYRLWKKMGFETVGVLPGAFRHSSLGYVDAYVMYKCLVTKP